MATIYLLLGVIASLQGITIFLLIKNSKVRLRFDRDYSLPNMFNDFRDKPNPQNKP